MLLTATPRTRDAWDIYHQLRLFHTGDMTLLPIDPPNLRQYFTEVEKGRRSAEMGPLIPAGEVWADFLRRGLVTPEALV